MKARILRALNLEGARRQARRPSSLPTGASGRAAPAVQGASSRRDSAPKDVIEKAHPARQQAGWWGDARRGQGFINRCTFGPPLVIHRRRNISQGARAHGGVLWA